MRYYSIEIEGGATYTNWINGRGLPGALNVEMEVMGSTYEQQGVTAWVRIHGISWQEISQANNLYNKNIKIFGGMQAGLPLSNSKFAGQIFEGHILQSFGNWIGTDMTLEFNCVPGTVKNSVGSPTKPVNLVVNAKPNQPMSEYLKTTLQTAFPGFQIAIDISSKLVRPNAEVGYYQALGQLNDYIFATSKDIINDPSYSGVKIAFINNNIVVQDSLAQSSTKQIAFEDLIGQPTWIAAGSVISFKCPMRADVKMLDTVTLPKSLIISQLSSYTSPANQSSTFQGNFKIATVRHLGNFRQPTADAWVTVFTANSVTANAAASSGQGAAAPA